MLRYFFIFLSICLIKVAIGQNPSNLVLNSPAPNLVVDSYTQASNSIRLTATQQSNFSYGFVNGGATNLLNLSIGAYPPIVNNNYTNPDLNPFTDFSPSQVLGSSDGNYNVTPTGQFAYELPIVCSPGTRDVYPKLSIGYNSIGANGLLGVGFNLSGLSTISRTGKNKFADGRSGGIELSSNDFFEIDGARLFLNTGNIYGDNGATYVPQAINHQTITSFGTAGAGPQYFIVRAINGFTIEYGNTSNSRLTANGDNSVLSWYINRITDEFGNYMLYTYNNSGNGELTIDKIEYTGNTAAGLQPYNKIKFSYLERSDKNTVYYGNRAFNSTKLLKSIVCTDINNATVRKYFFEYQFSVYSLLSKITEVDANDNQLNPVVFTWGEPGTITPSFTGTQKFDFLLTAPFLNNIKSTCAPDLNGDGYADLLGFVSNDSLQFLNNIIQPAPMKAKIGALFNKLSKGQLNQLTFDPSNIYPLTSEATYTAHLGTFIGDEDMDGRQEAYVMTMHKTVVQQTPVFHYEVVRVKNTPGTNNIVVTQVYDGTGNLTAPVSNNNTGWGGNNPSPFFFDIRDYDDDGRKDMVIIDQFSIRFRPGLVINGFSFGPEIAMPISPVSPFVPKIGDFDGDGKIDFYIMQWVGNIQQPPATPNQSIYNYKIYKLNNNSSAINLVYTSPTIAKSNFSKLALTTFDVGDFNGDGKTDVYSVGEIGGASKIYVSTGTTFNTVTPTISNFGTNDFLDLSAVDLNGDNKNDLVIKKYTAFDGNGNPTTSIYNTYYSFGTDVMPDFNTYTQTDHQFTSAFGDFNADGSNDYFVSSYSPVIYQLIRYSHIASQKQLFLTKIQTPKHSIDVTYNFARSAYDYNNRAIPPNISPVWGGTVFPVYKRTNPFLGSNLTVLDPAIYLVSTIIDNDKTTRFNYEDAVWNLNGQVPGYQFLGFKKISSGIKDLNPNINIFKHLGSVTSNTFDAVLNTVSQSETVNGVMSFSGTTFFGQNSPDLTEPGNPYYVMKTFTLTDPISSSTVTTNRSLYPVQTLNSRIFYTNSIFSSNTHYLNSTNNNSTVNINNSEQGNILNKISSTGVNTSTVAYTYILNNGNFKPSNIITTSIQQGESPYSRSVDYTYDQNGHLVSIVTDANLGNLAVTSTFGQFNNFGSPTSSTLSANDIQSRTSSKSYDATGRFIIQRTNAIGNTESFLYEPKYGNILQETNISGLQTNYQYNGLGRLTQQILPTSVVTTNSYAWDNTQPFNGSYSITTVTGGAPQVMQFHDRNDNLLRTESEGFNGSTVISESIYDDWNRITESSGAHFVNQTKFKKVIYDYSIDPFYRLTEIRNVVSNNGSDVLVNRIAYAYNSSSYPFYLKGSVQVTQINALTNSTLTSVIKENNTAGQIDRILNKDGGLPLKISNYTFFSNGQPKSVSLVMPDNSNANTQFAYDVLGRQSSLIDQSTGTTQYQYNSIGQLTTQINANGTYNFTYDLLGRITTKQGSGLGATTYQYETGSNGRENIKTIIGPNNITAFTYDQFGRMTERKETIGTKVLKNNYGYDVFDNVVNRSFPNNYTVDYVYDNIGNQIQIKNGSTVIWQMNSQFAPDLINSYSYNNGAKTTTLNYEPNQVTQLYQLAEKKLDNDYRQQFEYDLTGDYKMTRRLNTRLFATPTPNNEFFSYDDEDRLSNVRTNVSLNSPSTQQIVYKNNGNIISKTDASNQAPSYIYSNPNLPYNLTNIINASNNINLNTLNIQYNDLKKVSQINQTINNVVRQMDFTYGNNDERCRVDYSIGGNNSYTRYYTTNYDRQENANGSYKEWDYIYSPTGLAAVYYNNNGNAQLLYATTDMLGSPMLLENASGNVVEEYSFDAWGRRRNPVDWTFNNVPVPQYMIRGFTMHEHIDEFGLINMNGRIYDPVVGRFLQADNFVQVPDNLQNFNRYSYCYNNPLRYTDPDGQNPIFIIGAIIGGVSNLYANWGNLDNGGGAWSTFGRGAAAFGAGAVAGALSVTGPGGAMLGGAIVGATNAWLGGQAKTTGDFVEAALMGAFTGMLGSAVGAAIGPHIGKLAGSYVQGGFGSIVVGGATGAGVGAITGFAMTYVMTGDVSKALQAGKQGAVTGFVGGSVSSLAGYAALKFSKNPAKAPDRMEMKESRLPQTEADQELKYDPRIGKEDASHDFPYNFDEHIIKYGRVTQNTGLDNSKYNVNYHLEGTVNGKQGVYTITVDQNNIIYHRQFLSTEKFYEIRPIKVK